MNWRIAILLVVGCLPGAPWAYEIGTHALVTRVALEGSVLSSSHPQSILPVLGIDRLDQTMPFIAIRPDGTVKIGYFDNLPSPTIPLSSNDASNLFVRSMQNLEGDIFEKLINYKQLPLGLNRASFEQELDAWVMRGAIREDDNDIGPYSLGDRDDDPWNDVFRAGRHFYDPINERGLEQGPTCFTFGCRRATEWALGRTEVLTTPGTLDTSRENHFSWQDARDNFWWALTYHLVNDSSVNVHAFWQQYESGNRALRMATTLKSVGQVIHLIQDMAQPQHTRNDAHGPLFAALLTHDSATDGAFEAYTEARLFRQDISGSFPNALRRFDGSALSANDLPLLRIRGLALYPEPRFTTPVKFFTTQNQDVPRSTRRGIADLSNRGFFTASTLPHNVAAGEPDPLANGFADPPRPSVDTTNFYQQGQISTELYFNNAIVVKQNLLLAQVPDVLAPNWNAQSGLFSAFGSDGRMPILAAGQMSRGAGLIGNPTPITLSSSFTLSNEVFTVQADAMLPRAVAYSTGLIDYFFRGRLEVTPTAQKAFALLNQGEAHSMDAKGYPRRPDGRIFGFEKVRLSVRNVSDAITESGPVSAPVAQTSGNGVLVAVARFHRNACYQPDMSGERLSDYAPPPSTGIVSEPTCAPGTPARTGFQEIAVSAPLTIASAADLPGGDGTGGSATPVDKVFDFSADPIPVNATDLFIQVVYRGQLGEEPDGIAVGNYDVREPAFVGIYNNTDYYWNVSQQQWINHGATILFPFQNVDFLHVCTGASVDSRFAYRGTPVAGAPIMGVPVPNPGAVRLALLFAIPATPTQQFAVRVTPIMADATSAPQHSWFTRGAIHQASRESIDAAVLSAPQLCADNPTPTTAIWCQAPILRRRGLKLGHLVAPVFYDTSFIGANAADVDAPPALPPFGDLRLASTGEIRYNDPVLADCPSPPLPPTAAATAAALIDLLETAADLGIDSD